jgi:hypothetical protein
MKSCLLFLVVVAGVRICTEPKYTSSSGVGVVGVVGIGICVGANVPPVVVVIVVEPIEVGLVILPKMLPPVDGWGS